MSESQSQNQSDSGGELSGQILERWEILERIGEGGMSEVYRARHVIMNKIGAVKFLKADLSSDEAAVKRFQQEAMASASLGHGNVVQVYDCGVSDHGFYIILEFLEGVSLADVLDERAERSADGRGKLKIDEALPIFDAVCLALEHAHARGIVHRDMKPSNIMLIEKPEGQVVKLVDFGIAKIVQSAGGGRDVASLTRTGEVFGSPLYMSPEQCMGKPLDGRADLYSVGCLVYETLTGRKAISGRNPTETMMKHVQDVPELPGLDQLEGDRGPRLKAIVARCLEKDPLNRFSDMETLRQALLELAPRKKIETKTPVALIAGLTLLALAVSTSMALAIYGLLPTRALNTRLLDLKTPLPPLSFQPPVVADSSPEKQNQKVSVMSTGMILTRQKDWEKNGGLALLVRKYIEAGDILTAQKRFHKAGVFYSEALALLARYDEDYRREGSQRKNGGNLDDRLRAATGQAFCWHAQDEPEAVLANDDGHPSAGEDVRGERDLQEALLDKDVREYADSGTRLEAYKVYARLLESHKNYVEAYNYLKEGRQYLPAPNPRNIAERGNYLANLADLARITEDFQSADTGYESSLGLLEKAGAPAILLADLNLRAAYALIEDDSEGKSGSKFAKAFQRFNQAGRLYKESNSRDEATLEKARAANQGAYEAMKHYDFFGALVWRAQHGI